MTAPLNLHQKSMKTVEEEEKKAETMLNQIAFFILVAAAFVIFFMFYVIFTRPEATGSQSIIKTRDRAEISRRLSGRNMPLNTPVEISEGKIRYRFLINEKWERL